MTDLDKTLADINKRFGDGAIMRMGAASKMQIERFPSGSIKLDRILGGGIPWGRIIEIYGPESCVVGDTFLRFEVWGNGKRKNCKGGTIRRLYERFHNIDMGGPKQGRHLQHHQGVTYFVKSVNEKDRVVRNEVLDVVFTGKKPVWRVTTKKGYSIEATKEHKFLTPNGYLPLSLLNPNDTVYIHNNTRWEKKQHGYANRPEMYVKYHPHLPTKLVEGKYLYYRGQTARLMYEAVINDFEGLVEYKAFLDTATKEEIEQLDFIPANLHVHHIDEDYTNNAFDNLMLIDPKQHGRLHALDRHNNLRFVVVDEQIEDIVFVGERETFDLKCAFPYNNYIANGIVVHNSGKTTICQHIVAEAQKLGHLCAFIDMEHALDPAYAAQCGVDIDNLYISQPDTGEQALEIADALIKSKTFKVIVIDSVAALVPRAEIEGEMGDSVTFDTPVYIRDKNTKQIDIVPIASLYGGSRKFYGNRYRNIYTKLKSLEVLTHSGWESLNVVVFKKNKNNKETIITHTRSGYVKTTSDHCLFQNQKEIKPDELSVGDLIDVYDNEIFPESEFSFYLPSLAWLIGLWVGDGQVIEPEKNNINRRFSYSSIDLELINKITNVLKDSFGVTVKIKEPKPKGNRQQLYQLITSSSKKIGNFLEEAYCVKTGLKKIPIWVLNGTKNIRESFLEGFYSADGNHHSNHSYKAYYNNSLPVIAGIQYLLSLTGQHTSLTFSRKRFKQLTLSERNASPSNEIKRIIHTNEKEEFLYDIETGSGTFVTALGNIIVHNSHVGLQARLMSQALRKVAGPVKQNEVTLIFTNQIRHKIGVTWGSPETTSGGNALKFYASVRMDIRRIGSNKVGGEIVSNKTRIKIKKNKTAPPFGECEFDIVFGTGIDTVGELVDLGVELDLISKRGAWYEYKTLKAQGKPNFVASLEGDILESLKTAVRELL